MAYYELTEQSFINSRLEPVGAVVEYDGPTGSNLKPSTEEAFRAYHAFRASVTAEAVPHAGSRSGAVLIGMGGVASAPSLAGFGTGTGVL